jgi:hypothetical protein
MKVWNLVRSWRSKSYGDLTVWMSPAHGDKAPVKRSWLQELDRMAVTTIKPFNRADAAELNQ